MRTKAEDHIGEEFGIYKIIGVSPRKAKDGHSLYEAECKECGFVKTTRYCNLKNYVVYTCTHVHEYHTCYCLHCGNEIPIGNLKPSEYNGRKFCNASCSASYNNLHRDRDKKYCLNCGKEIPKQNKYCSQKCQHEYHQIEWEKKWLAGEVDGNIDSEWTQVRDRVRRYLFKKYDNKCSICGWGETNPHTGTIPLEVDHIDGDPYNSTPENLTLLCPNCHSLTKSYKGANKGNGRKRTWIPTPQNKIDNTA